MTDLEKQAREVAANFAFIQRDDDKGDLWNAACDHIANAFRHEANPFGNLLACRDAQPAEGDFGDLIGRLRDDAGLCKERSVSCRKIGDTAGQSLASQIADDLDEAAYVLAKIQGASTRAARPDREAVRQKLFDVLRAAFFAGRGSKPPKQYDSESVEAAWNRDIDAILALLPAEPVQEIREGASSDLEGKAIAVARSIADPDREPRKYGWAFEGALAALLPSEDGWREERERLRAALEYARNLLHLKGVQADEIDEALSEPQEQGEGK